MVSLALCFQAGLFSSYSFPVGVRLCLADTFLGATAFRCDSLLLLLFQGDQPGVFGRLGCGAGHGANGSLALLAALVFLRLPQVVFGLLQSVGSVLISAGCLGYGNGVLRFENLKRRLLLVLHIAGWKLRRADVYGVLAFLQ